MIREVDTAALSMEKAAVSCVIRVVVRLLYGEGSCILCDSSGRRLPCPWRRQLYLVRL